MIVKKTTYIIYADQIQEDNSSLRITTELELCPCVSNSNDIEKFEIFLSSQFGKKHKIVQWFPKKKSYIWFPKIKQYFYNKKNKKS